MRLLARHRDLPLARDASARFLPWLVAFMVYLAALAMVSAMAMQQLAARWDSGLAGRITVQIPPPADTAADPAARLQAAIEVITATPRVAGVEVLDRRANAALLQPWLGEVAFDDSLPLPDLISVSLHRDAPLVPPGLAERLAEAVPGATVDDHQRWLGGLLDLARSVKLVALLVVGLVGFCAATTVVFVTRTGLAIHRRVIELLHLIGAHDRHIAEAFQAHALRLGLKGGVLGLAAAVLTLLGLAALLGSSPSPLLPPLRLGPLEWALLALLPMAVALVAMLTARWTVLRTLARLT